MNTAPSPGPATSVRLPAPKILKIVECQGRRLLDQWMTNWNDIAEFEVIPVVTSAEAAAAVATRL